jgi:hypothetical protein
MWFAGASPPATHSYITVSLLNWSQGLFSSADFGGVVVVMGVKGLVICVGVVCAKKGGMVCVGWRRRSLVYCRSYFVINIC